MFKYSSRTLLKATSAAAARPTGAAASIGAIRTKYSLPELDYKLDALEPHISGQINDLHYNVCTKEEEEEEEGKINYERLILTNLFLETPQDLCRQLEQVN